MNNELERMWEEAYFEVIPGGTEETHEKPQSGYSVSRQRLNVS